MALTRILLAVLMVASTTAVLMNNVNEDEHQSMAAEVSKLKSQMDNLRQENVELKLRVQLKDLQVEVAGLRRKNSMLKREGKVLTTQAAASGEDCLPTSRPCMLTLVYVSHPNGANAYGTERHGSFAMVPTGTIGYVSGSTAEAQQDCNHLGDDQDIQRCTGARVVKVMFGEPYVSGVEAIVKTGDIEELTEGMKVKFLSDQWRVSGGFSVGWMPKSGTNNEYLPEDQDLKETMLKGETFKIDAFWHEDGQWGADMHSDSGKSDSVLLMYAGTGFMQVV